MYILSPQKNKVFFMHPPKVFEWQHYFILLRVIDVRIIFVLLIRALMTNTHNTTTAGNSKIIFWGSCTRWKGNYHSVTHLSSCTPWVFDNQIIRPEVATIVVVLNYDTSF